MLAAWTVLVMRTADGGIKGDLGRNGGSGHVPVHEVVVVAQPPAPPQRAPRPRLDHVPLGDGGPLSGVSGGGQSPSEGEGHKQTLQEVKSLIN